MPSPRSAEIQRAMSLRSRGNSQQALENLQLLVSQHPDDGELWQLVGLVALESKQEAEAQRAFERASLLAPLAPRSQLALAGCYERQGKREIAVLMYQFLAGREECETALLEPLSAALGRCGDAETALRVCRIASVRIPCDARPLMGIVYYMRRLRKPVAQILPSAYRAHQLDPANAECRITLAWMLHEVGRSEEGAEFLADVACEEFSCIRCLSLMQHLFEHVGDAENADTCRTRLMVLASQRNEFGGNSAEDV